MGREGLATLLETKEAAAPSVTENVSVNPMMSTASISEGNITLHDSKAMANSEMSLSAREVSSPIALDQKAMPVIHYGQVEPAKAVMSMEAGSVNPAAKGESLTLADMGMNLLEAKSLATVALETLDAQSSSAPSNNAVLADITMPAYGYTAPQSLEELVKPADVHQVM
jgi:hypothetical protein